MVMVIWNPRWMSVRLSELLRTGIRGIHILSPCRSQLGPTEMAGLKQWAVPDVAVGEYALDLLPHVLRGAPVRWTSSNSETEAGPGGWPVGRLH